MPVRSSFYRLRTSGAEAVFSLKTTHISARIEDASGIEELFEPPHDWQGNRGFSPRVEDAPKAIRAAFNDERATKADAFLPKLLNGIQPRLRSAGRHVWR